VQKRRLGANGPEISPIFLGGNVYGWTLDEAGSFNQFDRALATGLDCIDTADMYSNWVPGHRGGESETIIGNWVAKTGNRKKVFIATKLGLSMGEGKSGLSARYIAEAVEASLRRLQTDYIDLYQAHVNDPDTPLEETLGAFDKLVKAGKVRYIGASNYSGGRLAEAIEVSRKNSLASYVSLQPHYNLVERQKFESDQLPVVEKYGIGVIPYYSLAGGFLSGKYTRAGAATESPRAGGVEQYRNARGYAIVDALVDVAAQVRSKPATVALAWLMAQPGITAPIASATDDAQLDDLIAAAELRLDEASLLHLKKVSSPVLA
jgi:aryl-alcohol dehydrogenase-like predicted oxidoreductase